MKILLFIGAFCIMFGLDRPNNINIPLSREIPASFSPAFLYSTIDTVKLREYQDKLAQKLVATNKKEYQIDWAAIELMVGEPELALTVLEPLQSVRPSDPVLHQLLSLAYERLGKHQKALRSAEELYKFRERSCAGTKKLHLRLLENKCDPLIGPERIVNLKTDVNLKDFRKTYRNNPDHVNRWSDLRNDVWNLLRQRINLFPKPDGVMARLMIDMGDLHFLLEDELLANAWYNEALIWDPKLLDVVEERKSFFSQPIPIWLILTLVVSGIFALGAIWFVFKKLPYRKS
jgi:tetratricopeptide (TPR) repeat protein